MEWGQIQGQMRDPAAGCPATGMLPRNVTSATGCSFNPGGGGGRVRVWRKRVMDWLGCGVHSGHEGRGRNQNARVSLNLSIEEEVYMLRGAEDWGH